MGHDNSLFFVGKRFIPDLSHENKPPISRVHQDFIDLFSELVEGATSETQVEWRQVLKSTTISNFVDSRKVVPFRFVYGLMMIQLLGKKRPLLKTKANIFFVRKSNSSLCELWMHWWREGWSFEPKALGNNKFPKGSRVFFKKSSQ